MKKCEQCDVLVESGDSCPLCGAALVFYETEPHSASDHDQSGADTRPIGDSSAAIPEPGTNAGRSGTANQGAAIIASPSDQTTLRSARVWVFEMLSMVAFVTGIIVLASDFAFGFAVTWSQIPLAAIGFVYLFALCMLAFLRAPLLLLLSETVVISLFLLGLDALLPGSWFVGIALPVTLLCSTVTGAIVAISTRPKLNGLHALSVAVFGSGVFVVGLEIILSLASGTNALVSWSLVALACCVSVSLLILFINGRLRDRHAEFRKIFHL